MLRGLHSGGPGLDRAITPAGAGHSVLPCRPWASPFFSLHRQGFVRVAACTPRIAVGDPARNAEETLELLREGDARNVDLMLFPELGLSAYAIDDLLLQDALLDGVERGDRAISSRPRASLRLRVRGRRTAAPQPAPVQLRRRRSRDGRIVGVTPKSFLPNYREYYEHRWFAPGVGMAGREVTLAGQTVPFGTDLLFAAHGHRRLRLPRRDLRGLVGAGAAVHRTARSPAR